MEGDQRKCSPKKCSVIESGAKARWQTLIRKYPLNCKKPNNEAVQTKRGLRERCSATSVPGYAAEHGGRRNRSANQARALRRNGVHFA